MNTLKNTTSTALISALGLVGVLAACSSPADAGAEVEHFDYADGDYAATGSYQSPHGTETIDVQLTLEDNVVTDLDVTPHPTDPNVERFQGQFAGGIAEIVVGKNIDELDVDKVAGSSLTSGGFNDAIAQIKAEAVE